MGIKNYWIAGGSGAGKTTVASELQRLGHHVIHGDRELVDQGIHERIYTSKADEAEWRHLNHRWDLNKVKSISDDCSKEASFFCGGCTNFFEFIDLFDEVFILEVASLEIVYRRLDERVARDPTDWGGTPEEKAITARLYATKEDIPNRGIVIDSTAPVAQVVDTILSKCGL